MPAPSSLVLHDAHLTPLARQVLHAVAGVRMPLLEAARIRPSRANWLHAPWYSYHRGGAITVGRTIWFTRKWFEAEGYGDGSLRATWNWLQHLAHEVGHIPQAERFGNDLAGKARYVLAFVSQYGGRAVRLAGDVHDGAPLEIEADRGRWVLTRLLGTEAHPLVHALHRGDGTAVTEILRTLIGRIDELTRDYTERDQPHRHH